MDIPQPSHPFLHRTPAQTRFNDYDLLGHLNNNIYLVLADMGKAGYFRDAAPHLWDWRNVAMVVASIKCDFYAPSFPDEPLDILTAVTRISPSTITLEQRIVNPLRADEVKCIVTTVMVHVDPTARHSAPIPPEWTEAISTFEQHKF